MRDERNVGGLTCSQVLERLSDYLDGDVDPELRAKIEEHLRGCEGCARFGGELAATVQALRANLLATPRMPARVQERLREEIEGRGRS